MVSYVYGEGKGDRRYLIAHGEATIVIRRSPQVCHERDISQVNQIQPAIQHEPARLPVGWRKVLAAHAGEREAVEEEEGEDHEDGGQDAVPQFAVHGRLDVLLARDEIFHCCTQRIERPDVEGCERG